MKSTGIVRRVDELGRIVIPMELRNKLEIAEKDQLEIFTEGQNIVLRKYSLSCVFCGNLKSLIDYKGKLICKNCLDEINLKK